MLSFSKNMAVAAFSLFAVTDLAAAQPIVDFVSQSLKFQRGLDDDVSGSMSQHVTLTIKNVGNTPSRYPGSILRILLNGAVINANVYGSNGHGGYNLNAAIAAGQTGIVLFYLPLNTLAHCQRVVLQIDADRTYQYGGNVFVNDTSTLTAVDPTSIRFCVPPVVRHPISVDDFDANEVGADDFEE